MFLLHALLAVALVPSAGPARPVVAVFPMKAKVDVPQATAELVSDALFDRVLKSGAFSSVYGAREMEKILGPDNREALANCVDDDCLMEVAGGLGADFIIRGNLGKVGGSFLFNAQLLDVHTREVSSTSSRRLQGASAEVLLDGVAPVVAQLLGDAKLAAPVAGAVAPAPETPGEQAPGGRRWLLGGGGALAAGALLSVVAVALVASGASVRTALGGLPVGWFGVAGAGAPTLLPAWVAGYVAALSVGVLLALLAAGLGVAGTALLVLGAVS